jgi:hypothetical protein
MNNATVSYEVEIRCHFNDTGEVYRVLPFLPSCLKEETRTSWVTRFYGITLFRSGQLLREAEVIQKGQVRRYLGCKGPDIGHYANIRQEIDEEFTEGITDSAILKRLGGREGFIRQTDLVHELERLGHSQFMSFKGNETKGYDETLDVKVKMMSCPVLKWELIVELEKVASTEQEAQQSEIELQRLAHRFKIEDRMIREEPPTLLYQQFFSQ